MPWIEIFRAGKYPQGTFTQSDIQQIAQHDNPQFSEAPVVIGHPNREDPAFGWTKELKRMGNVKMENKGKCKNQN